MASESSAAPSAQAAPQILRGICKSVMSGDTIMIRGQPKGGPPPEKTVSLSKIMAPKMARPARGSMEETQDEPFAWEARENLRKRLVGQVVCFVFEYQVPSSGREFGVVYLGKDPETGENVAEQLLSEGLVSVRREGLRGDEGQSYCQIEDEAKANEKGRWGPDAHLHVRHIKSNIENPRAFVDKMAGKQIDAVVEYVRDGSTMRIILLPDFYQLTFMLSGVKAPLFKPGDDGVQVPVEPFAEQAKYFTEVRLLQRDIKVVLESVNNNNFIGSVYHPNGDIAELLLREGFARCVDWSIGLVTRGHEKLRAAEREAKEKRLRVWQNYQPSTLNLSAKDKSYTAKVVEVVNADALNVVPDGSPSTEPPRKIFLSSIRPPRLGEGEEGILERRGKTFRPLYDIPFMYDAREFLRKKLVGKKVSVTVDYVQPSSNNLPERTCCTVMIGDVNVAEALVAKGLAGVVRYRQDDDHRSAHYDQLLSAEMKAQKGTKGMHSSKENATLRIADLAGDLNKSKQFLPFLQRAGKTEAIVEFVASGSRLRVFIKRETCLATLLLAGISCPRASRTMPTPQPAEPWGDEAMAFTKNLCLQREVEVEVEAMDRVGNFIGWAFVDGKNLSVMLVEEGLASVHFSADRSQYKHQLQAAEDRAKGEKKGVWRDWTPPTPSEENGVDERSGDAAAAERKTDYKTVVITEVTEELRFYAQSVEKGSELVGLMEQIRSEFQTNPPLTGAYTPTRSDICAAKFDEDNQWYRARVEKLLADSRAQVFYMDYGNRQVVPFSSLAALPSAFQSPPAYAAEYGVAFAKLPSDPEFKAAGLKSFMEDAVNAGEVLINVEYRVEKTPFVTVVTGDDKKEDLVKGLISDGLLLVEQRREQRFKTLMTDYKQAEQKARKNHLNLWQYGDITEDEAAEFGYPAARG
ncbi:unnamed protein product [Cyprideis torosa]|uniref:Staphylococcal nuclease domain-containing protein 1 n=1 Tax=Cyprideis torosa TaxID=163714 RepID=A0A7R8ZLK8_9CRUS|nr:unnamed protein product [Cyprideis torosa]CAG0893449.1 unnamed protein product [Cyprideis torosa]